MPAINLGVSWVIILVQFGFRRRAARELNAEEGLVFINTVLLFCPVMITTGIMISTSQGIMDTMYESTGTRDTPESPRAAGSSIVGFHV